MDDAQKRTIKEGIDQNKHEVYVLAIDEFDKVVQAKLKSSAKAGQKKIWDDLRGKLEGSASYIATSQDLAKLAKVFSDLGFAGTKAYVKYHAGKAYIIFKGNPRLRSIFTGTRYGLQNAKVIQMGLGKHGALKSVKAGGVLTIILVSAFRVIDYWLTDQATMNQLIGALATDVVKIALATGAAILAGMAAATVFTIAIGPLVAAVAVGALTTYGLDKLDQNNALTEKVIAALDELEKGIDAVIQEKKKQAMTAANNVAHSAIDYAITETRRIVINTARHYLYKTIRSW